MESMNFKMVITCEEQVARKQLITREEKAMISHDMMSRLLWAGIGGSKSLKRAERTRRVGGMLFYDWKIGIGVVEVRP